MRYISKKKQQRFLERDSFNYLIQLWFNYNFLFFRSLIFRGLKLRAFGFFIKVKKGLKKFENFDPAFIFFLSMLQITPVLFIKQFKSGGSSFDIPSFLHFWKKISYACKWSLHLIKKKEGSLKVNSVVNNLVSSLINEGISMQKKFDVYSIAAKNNHLLKNKVFQK